MVSEKQTNDSMNPNRVSWSKTVGDIEIFVENSSPSKIVRGAVDSVKTSKSSGKDTLLGAEDLDKMKKMASLKQSQDKRSERKHTVLIFSAGFFVLIAIILAVIVILLVYNENFEKNVRRTTTRTVASTVSVTAPLSMSDGLDAFNVTIQQLLQENEY